MIFTFSTSPRAQPVNFNKSFDPLQTNPNTAARIQEINQHREYFYTQVSQIMGKPVHEVNHEFDWMKMLQYLNEGPDLLQHFVKESNYPAQVSFKSLASTIVVQETQGKF